MEYIKAGFDTMNGRFDLLESRMDRLELRIDKLEDLAEDIKKKMSKVEVRMDEIESRFGEIKLASGLLRMQQRETNDWLGRLDGRLEGVEGAVKDIYGSIGKIRLAFEAELKQNATQERRLQQIEEFVTSAAKGMGLKFSKQ